MSSWLTELEAILLLLPAAAAPPLKRGSCAQEKRANIYTYSYPTSGVQLSRVDNQIPAFQLLDTGMSLDVHSKLRQWYQWEHVVLSIYWSEK
jgi:hypothetical protein